MRERDRRETVPTRRKSVLADISKIAGALGFCPFLEPSLASLCPSPPSGPKWVKYNGYRMQARIEGQDIRLLTRKNLDRTKPFLQHRCSAERTARRSAPLDGESSSKTRMAFRVSTIRQSDLKAGRHYRFRYSCSTCSPAMASTDAGATCRRFSRQLANPISASTLKRTAPQCSSMRAVWTGGHRRLEA